MEEKFNELVDTFKSSIKTWDYFVNWTKVNANCKNIEIQLNKLNYLLGKENLRDELRVLLNDSPDIAKAFPILLAVRERKLSVIDRGDKSVEEFDFGSGMNADKAMRFLEKSKLVELFKTDGIKNLVDYVKGVEVGLDSNGRKNRGGTLMEELVEESVADFCDKNGFKYISQATAGKIASEFGVSVAVDKSSRRFDFAIYNPMDGKLRLAETNFYNGGGSKLKAVCGEFKALNDELSSQGIELIWITDGLGWHTARLPLEETFNHNDGRVYNLSMLENGVLDTLAW